MAFHVFGQHPNGVAIQVNNLSAYAALETEAELVSLGYTNVHIEGA